VAEPARLSFGLTLPQRGVLFGAMKSRDLMDLARAADENPLFDQVWVGDSLFAKPRPDSIALLGALAGVTSRVKLAVGCMASFPVRDPIVFAYQWATLDALSEGRMRLAVCTGIIAGGASEREGKPWGVVDKERAKRMSENIDICRKLWTGEKTSFDGAFTKFEDLAVQPKPVQDPCPIWIAANPAPNSPNAAIAMRRVARKADGWMTVEMFPGAFRGYWTQLSDELRAAGKDPATFPNVEYHNVNINEDADAAVKETKQFLDAYYGPVFREPQARAWTAHGSPESCIEQIRALWDAGAKAITFRITSWDQRGQYKRLVEEVLPFV
jgi:alkanesulfonate monooxygenase SsuD/methylene tetrahydromethanopterin reductase-like flavin-dependent oxidoreductase (luciferase family)